MVEDGPGPGLVRAELPAGQPTGGHDGVGALLAGDTAGDQVVENGTVQVVALGIGGADHVRQRRATQHDLSRDVAHDDGVGGGVEDGLQEEPTFIGGALGGVTLGYVDEIRDEPLELSTRAPFQGVDGFGFPPVLGGRVPPEAQQDLTPFGSARRSLGQGVAAGGRPNRDGGAP